MPPMSGREIVKGCGFAFENAPVDVEIPRSYLEKIWILSVSMPPKAYLSWSGWRLLDHSEIDQFQLGQATR